jgi:phage tail-like protein
MIATAPRSSPATVIPAFGRGLVPRLQTPHPLGLMLPALYQEDSFAQRLCAALDEVLSPIFSTLDNLDAYVDPWLAPEDFLDWLGTWVGLALDETWPLARKRAVVAHAHDLFRSRGTVRGLQRHIEIFTGGTVEIVDTGAVATSTTAESALPGSPNFALLVRVVVDKPDAVNRARLEALVATAKPAHVTHRVEIVKRGGVSEHVEVTTA